MTVKSLSPPVKLRSAHCVFRRVKDKHNNIHAFIFSYSYSLWQRTDASDVTYAEEKKTLLRKDADQPIGENYFFLSSRQVTFVFIHAWKSPVTFTMTLNRIQYMNIFNHPAARRNWKRADKLWAGADSLVYFGYRFEWQLWGDPPAQSARSIHDTQWLLWGDYIDQSARRSLLSESLV